MKTAFLFSGQGSQYAGMGKELCENFAEARHVYEAASTRFRYDVLKLSCEGSAQELARTAVSQPVIYTLSMAANAVLESNGVKPYAVAGFSLGEVSALTAAGVMDLNTGLDVINERAAAMQQAAEQNPGAMFAVIGAPTEEVERVCAETEGYVLPVNYNCPGQIVIAGEEDAAQKAADSLSASGFRVVRLAVGAAFHSKLMEGAAARFYDKIKDFAYSTAHCTVYSNITGTSHEITDAAAYLKTQMTSPVRFVDEMAAMATDGIEAYVELGPGKTLCGFIRKGIKGAPFYNAEDVKTVQKCLEALKG